ncbi:hypothetical protein ACN47E_004248 [Coniothyrium glycines]
MKAAILSAATLFFAPALAAPRFQYRDVSTQQLQFNINLSNDISGEDAQAGVNVNAAAVTLGALFPNEGHRIFATSLQALNPGVGGGNVLCAVIDPLDLENAFPLNARDTFVDFDRDNGVARQVDVTDFTIECQL